MISINKSLLQGGEIRVAVSGGIDSVVACHLLHRLGYPISIVHFNHNLRQQNEKMVDAACGLAHFLGVEFSLGIRKQEIDPTKSEEAELRKVRLNFFDEVGGDIVLAHHLDDAVESYLFNTFRGCPEHIPIPPVTQLNHARLVRPFLNATKDDFIDYARRNDLDKWVIVDETNADTKYRRNKIRHEIVPRLQEFGLRKIVRKKFYL